MIVKFVISIKDEADLPSGHKRKKAGDIIAVVSSDFHGGVIERKTYLLVKVDLGNTITLLDDARRLMIPEWETGDLSQPNYSDTYLPKRLRKRRYQIPWADLIAKSEILGRTIDMAKLLDPDIDYQPVEDLTIPFQGMIFDKILNTKLTAAHLTNIEKAGK